MPLQSPNLKTRIKTVNVVLSNKDQQKAVDRALQAASGDWSAAKASLKDKLPAAALRRIDLAHVLAAWSEDNVPIVKALAVDPDIKNLRDVALRYNVAKLAELVDPAAVPETTPGATS